MTAKEELFVVGVGASAGGVEALQELMKAMPDNCDGLALVILTHMPANHKSLLDDILRRFSGIPIIEIEDGMPLAASRIYVPPSGGILTIAESRLHFRKPAADDRARSPIDIFFASLAEDRGDRAIGIVLCGEGSDGTLGIKAIKQHGGLTIAEGFDKASSNHPAMPRSAITASVVDLVLPAQDIPAYLIEYIRSFHALKDLNEGDEERAETSRKKENHLTSVRHEICSILRRQVGHDFSGYKTKTFMRRVQRRIQILQLSDIDKYLEHLRRDINEVSVLFRDLLIGVTNFFRDKDAFDALENSIIPLLFDERGADDTIRVWVPGCATGEEVYSLAILMREHVNKMTTAPRVQIFATDIDEAALNVARTGRYPASMLETVPASRLERFFYKDGDNYTIVKEIRDFCIFSSHSVVRDPPFSRIDMISCRNLLIYLGADLQRKIIPVFHYALRPSGFLFLGVSENVTQFPDLFKPVERKHRIFQRCDDVASPARFPLKLGNGRSSNLPEVRSHTTLQGTQLRQAVEAKMLESFAPAHVVVNREGDIVYFSSRTGKYLEPSAGVPSRHLLGMAKRSLRLDLRSALHECMETRRQATRAHIPLEIGDQIQFISLLVEPFGDSTGDPFFLIVFNDISRPLSPQEADLLGRRDDSRADHSVENLERELRDTRERLQSIIEEYDTALEELKSSNEEMVSVNEELQATNEELETSKEELQSVNEELQTVNVELNTKVEEVDLARTDLENLFKSTRIPTIFLDGSLTIRMFTPAASNIFKLIPTDKGRPLTDISNDLDYSTFADDISLVLRKSQALERRVISRSGQTHYLACFLPYRTNAQTDGVVVSFIDVTTIVEAEEHQKTLVMELNHRVRNMLSVVIALGQQTIAKDSSRDSIAIFFERLHALARTYNLVSDENWRPVSLRDIALAELRPYTLAGNERLKIDGHEILMEPKCALAFGMVFHELVTNATKYGALSVGRGYIRINWSTTLRDQRKYLIVNWSEHDGPAVTTPRHSGFGTNMVEQQIKYGLDGSVEFFYKPEGLSARFEVPLDPCLISTEEE